LDDQNARVENDLGLIGSSLDDNQRHLAVLIWMLAPKILPDKFANERIGRLRMLAEAVLAL